MKKSSAAAGHDGSIIARSVCSCRKTPMSGIVVNVARQIQTTLPFAYRLRILQERALQPKRCKRFRLALIFSGIFSENRRRLRRGDDQPLWNIFRLNVSEKLLLAVINFALFCVHPPEPPIEGQTQGQVASLLNAPECGKRKLRL